VLHRAAVLMLAAGLTACASFAGPSGGVAPSGRTMSEMRYSNGLPDAIRFDADGRQVWEYTGRAVRGGAYRVSFDTAGRVAEVTPFRTPADVAQVKAGESRAPDVLALLGDPERIRVIGDGALSWEYPLPDRTRLVIRYGPGRIVDAVRIEGGAS
jgi:hypothetical protein